MRTSQQYDVAADALEAALARMCDTALDACAAHHHAIEEVLHQLHVHAQRTLGAAQYKSKQLVKQMDDAVWSLDVHAEQLMTCTSSDHTTAMLPNLFSMSMIESDIVWAQVCAAPDTLLPGYVLCVGTDIVRCRVSGNGSTSYIMNTSHCNVMTCKLIAAKPAKTPASFCVLPQEVTLCAFQDSANTAALPGFTFTVVPGTRDGHFVISYCVPPDVRRTLYAQLYVRDVCYNQMSIEPVPSMLRLTRSVAIPDGAQRLLLPHARLVAASPDTFLVAIVLYCSDNLMALPHRPHGGIARRMLVLLYNTRAANATLLTQCVCTPNPVRHSDATNAWLSNDGELLIAYYDPYTQSCRMERIRLHTGVREFPVRVPLPASCTPHYALRVRIRRSTMYVRQHWRKGTLFECVSPVGSLDAHHQLGVSVSGRACLLRSQGPQAIHFFE